MDAAKRLADALKEGGKIKGHKVPVYWADGRLKEYAVQMVEVVAGDILEVCKGIAAPTEIMAAQLKGCGAGAAARKVTLLADDVFHILEQAAGN